MRRIALGLGTTVAAAGLAWALVTTGHWPLDDRKQPASAIYALNGGLGEWLVEHGGSVPAGGELRDEARRAATVGPLAHPRNRGGPGPDPAPGVLTAAELGEVQKTLRTDPRFRDRFPFKPVPAAGASSGRG